MIRDGASAIPEQDTRFGRPEREHPCAREGCPNEAHPARAPWTSDGRVFCSPSCAAGPCPTCGKLGSDRLWAVGVITSRPGFGSRVERVVFCSRECAEAKTAEQAAARRRLDDVFALLEDLTRLSHDVVLLDGIARGLFRLNKAVEAVVLMGADATLKEPGAEPKRSLDAIERAWARAWEIDAEGGRSKALHDARALVAMARLTTRRAR